MVYVYLVLFSCLLFAQVGHTVTTTWTGDAGDGNWENAGNWTSGAPGGSNTAKFDDTGRNLPTSGMAEPAILLFESGTLTIAPTSLSLSNSPPNPLQIVSGNQIIDTETILLSVSSPQEITIEVTEGSLEFSKTLSVGGVVTGTNFTKLSITGNGITRFSGDTVFVSTPPPPDLLIEGNLEVSSSNALGEGSSSSPPASLELDNGQLIIGTNTFTITSAIPITLTGSAIVNTNGNSATFASTLSGSGELEKKGEGVLYLTHAANSYGGGTKISGGTLSITATGNLGSPLTTPLTLESGGALQVGASITLHRAVTLSSGLGVFDTNSETLTIDASITGNGTLEKTGLGTLHLMTGVNDYSGGTTVTKGTLLGSTPQLQGAIDVKSGAIVVFDQTTTGNYGGTLSGEGKLEKKGDTLILSGVNSYSGGTKIDGGILKGNTSSLQGDIDVASGSVVFSQAGVGTYKGSLSGSGTMSILGGGTVTMSVGGTLSGITTVDGNSTLVMNGSLASSSLTVKGGSTLKGKGTVGPTATSGQVVSGIDGEGNLTVNGPFGFSSGSLLITLTPTGAATLDVQGIATLTNGDLNVALTPGFYGYTIRRTLLRASSVVGEFNSPITIDPRLQNPEVIYNPTNVELKTKSKTPFSNFSLSGFPYDNANERSTGNNLDALISAGQESQDMVFVVDSLAGLSVSEINDALDQMHPAAQGAFSELQVALGGQLLASLHRMQRLPCACDHSSRIWAKCFGNWLDLKRQGMQIAFDAETRGILIGYDHLFFDFWTVGLAGAYSDTQLKWSLDRGYSYIKGGYCCVYSDFSLRRFFLGGSGYVGKDSYNTNRHVYFSTVDRQAYSSPHGFDAGAQMMMAYFLGTPSFAIYPYATIDYLYLETSSFNEAGADALNLRVNSYESSTLRSALGGTMRFADRNRDDSFCIAPLISMGYVLETPIRRDHYRAKFSGVTIPFKTRGWDKTWHLLNLKFGLDVTYKCISVNGEYHTDISTDGDTPYVNQRANIQLKWVF